MRVAGCPNVVLTFRTWQALSGCALVLPTYLTESVKSPGLLLLGLAKKLPSTPLVNSRFSASTPVIFGWNHLERERKRAMKNKALPSTPLQLKCLWEEQQIKTPTHPFSPTLFDHHLLIFPTVGTWRPAGPVGGTGAEMDAFIHGGWGRPQS